MSEYFGVQQPFSESGASKADSVAKIVIIAPAIAREGITKQIANQINGLLQKGIKVGLVVLAKSDVEILEEFGISLISLPILQLQQPNAYLSPRALVHSFQIIFPIICFLKKQKTEAVVAHSPYAHFVMRLVKLMVPKHSFVLIQYFHGLQYSEYPLTTWRRRLLNNWNKYLAKRLDDRHVSVSEAVMHEIFDNLFPHQKHRVISNSLTKLSIWDEKAVVEWQKIEELLQLAVNKFKILLPNRIDHNKGQSFFIEVLKTFFDSGVASSNNIIVFIVGDGPQKSDVQRHVFENGLERVVTLTGAVQNIVVQKLMKEVELVVVPSFQEGFSFSVQEALYAGCIVLASETGGIQEMIHPGETGFLFKAGDKEDCLRKLEFIFLNRDKQLVDQQKIERFIKNKFSLEHNIEQLLKLIAL